MEALMLEGTWEEVRSHDAELTGRRVRLIIVDGGKDSETPLQPPATASTQQPTLAELFAGRIGNMSFDPPELSENTEGAFGEILDRKYRDGTL